MKKRSSNWVNVAISQLQQEIKQRTDAIAVLRGLGKCQPATEEASTSRTIRRTLTGQKRKKRPAGEAQQILMAALASSTFPVIVKQLLRKTHLAAGTLGGELSKLEEAGKLIYQRRGIYDKGPKWGL